MRTIFVTSLIGVFLSFLGFAFVCMFGFDAAPTPWDIWDRFMLFLLISLLVWLGLTVWSGIQLWKKRREAPGWLKLVVIALSIVFAVNVVVFFSN